MTPALVPLCMADTPAREITTSGSLLLASVAFGVHMVAMLVTAGVIAAGVCRGVAMHSRLRSGAPGLDCSVGRTGMLLIALC